MGVALGVAFGVASGVAFGVASGVGSGVVLHQLPLTANREEDLHNLLFRWFVGLGMDDAVWVPTTFSKNRDRLLEGNVAQAAFNLVRMRNLRLA